MMKISRLYCYFMMALAASVLTPMAACSDAKGGTKNDSGMQQQRPDKALAELMQSITSGDAPKFASFCIYPINRPYPIRSIGDSATMVDYFPILVDTSFKENIGKAKIDDWDYRGWRGWALGDSTILWFDEGLEFIDYESQAETGLRKILAREEIMSLHPELRGEWTPMETMVEIDGNRVFRIDADKNEYRLLEYEKPEDMRGKPVMIMTGSMDTEGSAELITYTFTDSIGNTAEYSPDMEPPVKVIITSPKGPRKEYKVRRSYWRDHLR